jgi:mono/diheme cytochrome c family protein
MPSRRCRLALLLALLGAAPTAAAEPALFTERVAPVLRQRCLSCHGARKRGGLDLTTRAGLLKGGDGGPVVAPGSAAKSRLIQMVSGPDAKMPKQGPKLTAAQVAALREWVEAGAPWPDGVKLAAQQRPPPDEWWSLRPLARPAVPAVKDRAWPRTPLDAFVLAALEARGLRPSPPADRATLIRRVTFDLHGLPPTPEEIDAFVNDRRPQAYERLIERLLASPRYGERWGRHWLDVVHYGDTHGYDKDKRRDHAWPYRDYVIRAFNNDKPYSRFVKEQLAGDVLYPDGPEGVVATGFVVAGPWDFVGHVELREGTVDKEKTRLLDRDDMVTNALSTFLSLTVGCARCHDHKFDPIPQKDYYRLQAVFAGVERGNRPYPNPPRRAAKDKPAAPEQAYAVVPRSPRPVFVLHRGNVEARRQRVTPGGLSCVKGLSPDFDVGGSAGEGTRRAALAAWVTDPNNALTWRSVANRVWHYHFGRGLVDTPNDFGRNGSLPTHPQLLDWLAVEFRDGGGSFKALHRLVLLSNTYRQSSRHDPAAAKVDADNRYLWRMNRQRLDAESVRDAVLAVSGKLDLRPGGPGFELFRFKDDHSPVYDHTALEKVHDPATYRRTVYRFTVRSVPNPFLDCLDCADPNLNTPVRNTTLTALQALALLNDPFTVRQAEHFAARVRKVSDDPGRQIDAACRLALGRLPRPEERAALAAYARKHGMAGACRVLFNTNEFVFID